MQAAEGIKHAWSDGKEPRQPGDSPGGGAEVGGLPPVPEAAGEEGEARRSSSWGFKNRLGSLGRRTSEQ